MPKFKYTKDENGNTIKFTFKDQMKRAALRAKKREELILFKAQAYEGKKISEGFLTPDWIKYYDEKEDFEFQKQLDFKNKMLRTKAKFLFVTLNFDEKLVTPGGTLEIVKNIINYKQIKKACAFWEWRDVEAETGLHCHLLLLGDTFQIKRKLLSLNGSKSYSEATSLRPYNYLVYKKNTSTNLMLYPCSKWFDKINYCLGNTFSEEKDNLKIHYPRLRLKHKLPNITT